MRRLAWSSSVIGRIIVVVLALAAVKIIAPNEPTEVCSPRLAKGIFIKDGPVDNNQFGFVHKRLPIGWCGVEDGRSVPTLSGFYDRKLPLFLPIIISNGEYLGVIVWEHSYVPAAVHMVRRCLAKILFRDDEFDGAQKRWSIWNGSYRTNIGVRDANIRSKLSFCCIIRLNVSGSSFPQSGISRIGLSPRLNKTSGSEQGSTPCRYCYKDIKSICITPIKLLGCAMLMLCGMAIIGVFLTRGELRFGGLWMVFGMALQFIGGYLALPF
jgi:hypothetical protein